MSAQRQNAPTFTEVRDYIGAAFTNDVEKLRAFVMKYGVEFIDVVETADETALMKAASVHSLSAFNYLLNAGADINVTGWLDRTILMNEIAKFEFRDEPYFLIRLLTANADLEMKDKHGMTALLMAVEAADIDGVRLLLEHGADMHAVNNKNQGVYELMNEDKWHPPSKMLNGRIPVKWEDRIKEVAKLIEQARSREIANIADIVASGASAQSTTKKMRIIKYKGLHRGPR